jgi:hypothetical protein
MKKGPGEREGRGAGERDDTISYLDAGTAVAVKTTSTRLPAWLAARPSMRSTSGTRARAYTHKQACKNITAPWLRRGAARPQEVHRLTGVGLCVCVQAKRHQERLRAEWEHLGDYEDAGANSTGLAI